MKLAPEHSVYNSDLLESLESGDAIGFRGRPPAQQSKHSMVAWQKSTPVVNLSA